MNVVTCKPTVAVCPAAPLAKPLSKTLTDIGYVPAGAADIVQVIEVVVAAVTLHEPVLPMDTLFELSVVLKPVPVIVRVEPDCVTAVIVGV